METTERRPKIQIGDRHEKLVVVSIVEKGDVEYIVGTPRVRVRCDCGTEKILVSRWFYDRKTCGCYRDSSYLSPGDVFGFLTVIEKVESDKNQRGRYQCECACGNVKDYDACKIKAGTTKSCGCQKVKRIKDLNASKDHFSIDYPAEYEVWRGMLRRCYDSKYDSFHRYGGRGITVCDRWRESVANFIADMGLKPDPKYQIDRLDNDGNYELGNCRWVTPAVNNRNRSDNVRITHDGRTQVLVDWFRELDVLGATYYRRLGKGYTPKQALGLELCSDLPPLRSNKRKLSDLSV